LAMFDPVSLSLPFNIVSTRPVVNVTMATKGLQKPT